MHGEPSAPEGPRTFPSKPLRETARALAERSATPQLMLVLIALALLLGVGLGALFSTPSPPPPGPESTAAASLARSGVRSDSEDLSSFAGDDGPGQERGPVDVDAAQRVADLLGDSGGSPPGDIASVDTALSDGRDDLEPASPSLPPVSANRPPDADPMAKAEVVSAEVANAKRDELDIAHDQAVSIDSLPVHHSTELVSVNPFSQSVDPTTLTVVTRGEIASGESLGSSLRKQGIHPKTVHLIATEMRKVFDFRNSRPGDAYRLGQDSEGRVLDFRYSQSPEESYYLAWEGTRYTVEKETAELHAQIAKIAGIVETSFYAAIVSLGEEGALAADFARIFAWDIDFSRNTYPGDEFSILYERLYRRARDGKEIYVRPGRILAARYVGKTGPHTVVYFEDERHGGAYFRPDGSSVERAFLVAPLEFSRISSRFTRSRRHPILNVTRPHLGIDYAAPHGTPVYAVAEGVVEYRSRAGASGNLVRIRHSGGYTSHYAHLSRFEKSLNVGDPVKQKQIIGYVGSSGLSTGPHVCFRVKKDGKYVDPMKISSPAGSPVEFDRLADFQSIRDQLLAGLGPTPGNLIDEAL